MAFDYTVTLDGTFYTIRAALPYMRKQKKGAIINISSGGGIRQEVTIGPYCAAKRAILSLTETVAIEYGREGIRCNAICPGPIATPPLLAFVARCRAVPARMRRTFTMNNCRSAEWGNPKKWRVWRCSLHPTKPVM